MAGYRAFLDFYQKEYYPQARTTLAASELPNGRAVYAHEIRRYTTLDLAPEEIHRIGLSEVARIRKEMDEVIRQVGFEGDFAAFLHFLRTDPRFYPKTPEELLERAAWIAKTIDGKLPALFGYLPRTPYTVQPVPEHMAPKYTAGHPAPLVALVHHRMVGTLRSTDAAFTSPDGREASTHFGVGYGCGRAGHPTVRPATGTTRSGRARISGALPSRTRTEIPGWASGASGNQKKASVSPPPSTPLPIAAGAPNIWSLSPSLPP